MQRKLQRVKSALANELPKAFVDEANKVMSEAQNNVPVITGRLRSSAYVRTVARNQHRTDVRFGYDAPYAASVHENPNSRGWKWLYNAFLKVTGGTKMRVAERLKRALKGR